MKRNAPVPHQVSSISGFHNMVKLGKPAHPLVSLIDFLDVASWPDYFEQAAAHQFYCIGLRINFDAAKNYGQQHYDFDSGMMTFLPPGHPITLDSGCSVRAEGFLLMIHTDFIQTYPLASRIKEYSFFSYLPQEALHLSETEKQLMMDIMKNIGREINSVIGPFSQDVIVSYIDLLLNQANRFYNRQSITRKSANNALLVRMDRLLTDYFDNSDQHRSSGLPTVQYFAKELNVSPDYLSDVLRVHTGFSAKYHIQNKLIDKAKAILATTSLSVSEIAYQLGFEYPQSFNKLFKSKTNVSPLVYRQSIN